PDTQRRRRAQAVTLELLERAEDNLLLDVRQRLARQIPRRRRKGVGARFLSGGGAQRGVLAHELLAAQRPPRRQLDLLRRARHTEQVVRPAQAQRVDRRGHLLGRRGDDDRDVRRRRRGGGGKQTRLGEHHVRALHLRHRAGPAHLVARATQRRRQFF